MTSSDCSIYFTCDLRFLFTLNLHGLSDVYARNYTWIDRADFLFDWMSWIDRKFADIMLKKQFATCESVWPYGSLVSSTCSLLHFHAQLSPCVTVFVRTEGLGLIPVLSLSLSRNRFSYLRALSSDGCVPVPWQQREPPVRTTDKFELPNLVKIERRGTGTKFLETCRRQEDNSKTKDDKTHE